MDNKDVEFFNFDDDFNLDDLDFKKSGTSSNTPIDTSMQNNEQNQNTSSLNSNIVETGNMQNQSVDNNLQFNGFNTFSNEENNKVINTNPTPNNSINEGVNNTESVSNEDSNNASINNNTNQVVENNQNINNTENESTKNEELENPVIEMINNKKTMKLIITLLVVLFLAVILMPKVFELLANL